MNKPAFSRPPLLIGIGGTTRPGSSTERALAAALAHARTLGAQTQLFGGAELAALPPFNPEVTTRTPQETAFVEAVRQADGILLASPGYHGGVSGLVKNAIDLLEDLRGDSRVYLDGRAVGCIVTAAGWQGCNTTLGAMRLPLVNLLPSGDDMLRHIWLTIRLPRVLLALLVGAALALSGCVMQGLFRNPLADPGLLGISSGAALAVACWLVLPLSASGLIALYMPMLAAFIGSLAVMVVIFILSRAEEGSLSRLLLVGIAINALCGALVGVLAWLSNDAQLRQLSLWGMGSLGQAEWPTLLVATTLIIPAALAVWWMASHLNLLQLGDEEAHYLGVNVRALQRWLLLCSAVLVAAAVAISGVIGFIGLVVPHLMRLWLGPDHRGLIPGSLLAGAILLLLADTLARTVAAPAEMPVGLLTSLLGAPWFLWLVFRRENSRHG